MIKRAADQGRPRLPGPIVGRFDQHIWWAERSTDARDGIRRHLSGLTGDAAAIDAVAKAYRVYLKKVPLDQGGYTMDHTAIVYLMDKEGRKAD